MRIRLNLSQQAGLLVGVPAGLLSVFLVLLFVQVVQLEQEGKESEHSKTVIAVANSFVKQYYDTASQLLVFKHARTEEAREGFETRLSSTFSSFKQLKALLKDDSEELKMLDQMRGITAEGISLMKRYENHIAGSAPLNELQVALLYKEMDDCGAAFTSKLDGLTANETTKHRFFSKQEERHRADILMWIAAGIPVSIGIGVLLWLCILRNITSRLETLVDNTQRLSRKEELLPSLVDRAQQPGRKEQLLPILAEDDEISRLDLFFHKMADDLAEAARKERAILDNAVDVICSISAEGQFVSVNPASMQVWGYPPEKLTGMHYSEILTAEDTPKFLDSLANIRKTRELINLENRVISQDGQIIHTLWSLRWSESEQSLFCVAHDISDRKEVERVKQEFVAVISHELRTPLTSLQMTLSLLLDGTYGPLSNTAQKRVKSAEFGISRLISLINDLLDIEKMEAGKLTMTYSTVDLEEITQRSLDTVQGFAEQQHVALRCDAKSMRLSADSDRIIQVMVNLLSNAIKFSDEGCAVEVYTLGVENCCEVQIVDHGAGVPAGYEETIFAKYEQAHKDRSKRRRGTGLGLPICKAIVEQHGGVIGVRSTEGGGSTFWFRIPALPEEDGNSMEPSLPLRSPCSVGSKV